MNTLDFLVRKDQLATVELRSMPEQPLNQGEVRVRIDRFALTSKNITYAAFGEAMNYWAFFPVGGLDDAGLGAYSGVGFWHRGAAACTRCTTSMCAAALILFTPPTAKTSRPCCAPCSSRHG